MNDLEPASRATLIRYATERLRAAGVVAPERDARLICRWAAALDGAGLATALDAIPDAAERGRFETAVDARARRVPVAQITGRRDFWGRAFRVTSEVLDPRPETEALIEAALSGAPARRILDLGVGSGCILLTLLAEWPEATGLGVDISQAALAVARDNAHRLGVEARVALARSNWFGNVQGSFDLIVSNPPYIPRAEIAELAPEVRLHEPSLALDGGADGLDSYRVIAAGACARLAPGGRMLLEVGATQAEAVTRILDATSCGNVDPIHDLDGRIRVLSAIPR